MWLNALFWESVKLTRKKCPNWWSLKPLETQGSHLSQLNVIRALRSSAFCWQHGHKCAPCKEVNSRWCLWEAKPKSAQKQLWAGYDIELNQWLRPPWITKGLYIVTGQTWAIGRGDNEGIWMGQVPDSKTWLQSHSLQNWYQIIDFKQKSFFGLICSLKWSFWEMVNVTGIFCGLIVFKEFIYVRIKTITHIGYAMQKSVFQNSCVF